MVNIARSVEIYNQAYRLAWPHVSENKIRRPDVSKLLSNVIRARIKIGATDPVKIAADSVAELRDMYRD